MLRKESKFKYKKICIGGLFEKDLNIIEFQ